MRRDAGGKPFDEADTVEPVTQSDERAEPGERRPGALMLGDIAPGQNSGHQQQRDGDASDRRGIAVSLLLMTGVLRWSDIAEHKRAWTTFAWLGALIALCDGLNRVGFVNWFAHGIAPHMTGFSPIFAMVLLLAIFFVAHYLFASVDAYTTALLPVILVTGAAIPGLPVKEFALLLCMELGIMGIITPFADAASPIYANSGYLPAKDYWRLGTIFGAIFLIVFLAIGVPWASLL